MISAQEAARLVMEGAEEIGTQWIEVDRNEKVRVESRQAGDAKHVPMNLKSRLVALGNQEKQEVRSDSPTAVSEGIHLVFSFASSRKARERDPLVLRWSSPVSPIYLKLCCAHSSDSVVCEWSNNGQAWRYQRQSWRWLSRKRKRYEKTRYDSWKWQCDMCDGRNWQGWNCANCGWEWKNAGHTRDTPQILPAQKVAEDQDTEMLKCNPCLTETMRTEALTIPTPKATPIGARLDSALARQARARRAYETARKMLNMAKQRMEETTTEMERADAAVENVKKKVGPATRMASDVVKPHLSTLSSEAADLIARIEGEMKAAKTNEENSTEEKKIEALEDQQEKPVKPMTDAQEIASQLQALEAMRMAEAEERRKTEGSSDRSWKESKNLSAIPCGKPQQRSQQYQGAETGCPGVLEYILFLVNTFCDSCDPSKRGHDREGSHRRGQRRCDGNLQRGNRSRLVRIGGNCEDQKSQSGPGPLQAVLIKKKDAKTVARTKRCGRSMSGSWIRYRTKSERRASKREQKQFNSTLGYPGEGPPRVKDFGNSVKCSECDLVPWRVSRNGDPGKCEECKNVRKRGTEMMKCKVCAWRICATCHNIALRGEAAESPPEMTQPGRDEDGDVMMMAEGIPTEDEMMRYEEQRTLESLRQLSEKNMPNTITFIPHRMRKRFARIYSAKIGELSSHMWMGIDTPKREMLNLLVWAIPALLLSEDDTSVELHKEHHSKTAGLNQRLAEAERDEWTNLIERARRKQQEEEEMNNMCPNQLEDKEQAYLRKVNRAIYKANNGCLRAAKQILMGGSQAPPCEETTKMVQGKLPKDDLTEERWKRMSEEIAECKKLSWKVQPLCKRRVVARLEMTKKGQNQVGRERETPT